MRELPLLRGLLPVDRPRIPREVLAGVSLAVLAVPEALGYARIAGMPVQTGLYTMLAPAVVFVLLGASRHLVIGADSATAAILSAGLAGLATPAAQRYVELAAGVTALVACLLLIARIARIGFLADFLSGTVLAGFLAGVGLTVAAGQLADMLGVKVDHGPPLEQLGRVLSSLRQVDPMPAAVSIVVIVLVIVLRRAARQLPGPLIAITAAIVISDVAGLAGRDWAVLGPVPAGLPRWSLPTLSLADWKTLLPTALSMFVVIVAQSAATARAYAARYAETVSTDADLTGLAGANLVSALSGAFVVNGSPTRTQMVDAAGGRTQLGQLVSVAIVAVVLIGLTGPLSGLPLPALAAVVFIIGLDLIDHAALRRMWSLRRAEGALALLTAVAVVILGVGVGIAIAVAASILEHLRHSYTPHDAVLVKSPAGHWQSAPVMPGARTVPGLIVYRFGTSAYFANASRIAEDINVLIGTDEPIRWFCFDCAAIGDIDYTAGTILGRVCARLADHKIRVVFSAAIDPVRTQLAAYGMADNEQYETAGAALEEFQREDR